MGNLPRLRISLWLPFSLMVAFGALSGCTSEDYYCDSDACYFCDGVGCREVDPTPRPECDEGFLCATGSSCTVLGCTFTCAADAECEMGTVCTEGYCVAPTEEPPATCSDDASICGATELCVDGRCVVDPGPTGCTDASTCEAGESCVSGECRATDATCRFNTECGPGRVCVDQACTAICSADNPCGAGQVCGTDGFCAAAPPVTGTCSANADCAEAELCIDSACVPGCASDAQCADGLYCSFGQCRVDDRPSPFCSADSECAAGSVCRNGACRSPCSEHAECPAFDVSLTFCLEMLCATTNEATSDCGGAADCQSGQSCIDGVCR